MNSRPAPNLEAFRCSLSTLGKWIKDEPDKRGGPGRKRYGPARFRFVAQLEIETMARKIHQYRPGDAANIFVRVLLTEASIVAGGFTDEN